MHSSKTSIKRVFRVPAVFLTEDIKNASQKVTEELKSVKFTVIEMLDSEDPASGELLQACKCLRHELNRSDDEIKTIQFISNCLVLVLQCFDCTQTFVEPQKLTQIRHLVNTLSYELKTQGLEASQQLPTGRIRKSLLCSRIRCLFHATFVLILFRNCSFSICCGR